MPVVIVRLISFPKEYLTSIAHVRQTLLLIINHLCIDNY